MNTKLVFSSIIRMLLALTILAGLLLWSGASALAASQFDIIGPVGSSAFGTSVTVLPNGNIVITDPSFNGGIGANAGAVYLYNGASGTLISTLTGMTANDLVGSGGVTVLSNGNYLLLSPNWDNGANINAGAVTWGNALSGVTGAVSALNSLVGSTASDGIGTSVIALNNGNYLVLSPLWDNAAITDAGAVTWGSGSSGVAGAVSAANSLVGNHASDSLGTAGVVALSNGNYVVDSPQWNNGAIVDAGAITWGNGLSGVTGLVSTLNSLMGSTTNDSVGAQGVSALSNGNFVVRSRNWDNGAILNAGAVTWGNGNSGITGPITALNSLVGSQNNDQVGFGGMAALSNGNYVVRSPLWNNGAIVDAGAVTWGSGASGVAGSVSALNSLVGGTAGDTVGSGGVSALTNGNYVVINESWDNGAVLNAGAVTWGNGTSGIGGLVSTANSLVGSTTNDQVGSSGVTALSNGNYVVRSVNWANAAIAQAGAVTWGSGTSGVAGAVSVLNSLVGSTATDLVGNGGVTVLSNGNYVVVSYNWHNGATLNAGAVTWGNGASGVTGAVSALNSLVGSTTGDAIGAQGVIALSNGNYVVQSSWWNNGAITFVGAVTWGSGLSGITGPVTALNSLVGSTTIDLVGSGGVVALNNGNYVVVSSSWDNVAIVDAGAVTWGDGLSGAAGVISTANSLVGSTATDQVGSGGVVALSNGNYLVRSLLWDNGAIANAGAVTWGNGASGVAGSVSALNSLVGSTTNDQVGWGGVTALSNGNYVVSNPFWNSGAIFDEGAVTWGFRASGATGSVSAQNSVLGLAAGGGSAMVFQYDAANHQLVVGRPADNIVTLFRLDSVYLPVVSK